VGCVNERPSRADLDGARDKTLPDVAGPGLRVLFSGINPGLYSAATGYHFARPGNRFWPALYRSGFTPRQLDPSEQEQLLELGLGITNVAARATARADELDAAELREAGGCCRRSRGPGPAVAGHCGRGCVRGRVRKEKSDRGAAGADPGPNPGLGAAQPEWPQRAMDYT